MDTKNGESKQDHPEDATERRHFSAASVMGATLAGLSTVATAQVPEPQPEPTPVPVTDTYSLMVAGLVAAIAAHKWRKK